ncbi:hypothetical protein [Ewingella americana]|uniref:hypothetical protein n=1 Tax=Ewingella americana TaxID=41202 RepID=UPI001386B3B0|nr:hypothetical protein [Ewingella americana]
MTKNFITGDVTKAVPLEDIASSANTQNKPHQPVRGQTKVFYPMDELPFYDKGKKDE